MTFLSTEFFSRRDRILTCFEKNKNKNIHTIINLAVPLWQKWFLNKFDFPIYFILHYRILKNAVSMNVCLTPQRESSAVDKYMYIETMKLESLCYAPQNEWILYILYFKSFNIWNHIPFQCQNVFVYSQYSQVCVTMKTSW